MLVCGWWWLLICYSLGTAFGLAVNGWIKTERENTLLLLLWGQEADLFEARNKIDELAGGKNDKA